MWERWNGDTGDPGMNSFNHYAFGAVGEWLYRYMAGIDTEIGAPGYRHVVIRPHLPNPPDPAQHADSGTTVTPITHARASYHSMYGKVVSEWTANPGERITLNVTIPANTTATIAVPTTDVRLVLEGGKPIPPNSEIKLAGHKDGYAMFNTGAGTFRFSVIK